MKRTERMKQIENLVTLELAQRWEKDSEPTLFFETEVLEVLGVNITLSTNPLTFNLYEEHFENICEKTLELGNGRG